MKCLLLKTKENKLFLTYEKNLLSIIEFIKTFDIELQIVATENKKLILELKDLIKALCNPLHKCHPIYNKIKTIYPKRKRENIIKTATEIKEFIKNKFLTEGSISLKSLKNKFSKYNLTDACLCHHLTTIRKSMSKEG